MKTSAPFVLLRWISYSRQTARLDARVQEGCDLNAARFDVVHTFPVAFDCKRGPADVTICSVS